MSPQEIISAFERADSFLVQFMQAEGRLRGHPFKSLVVEATLRLRQSRQLLRRFHQTEIDFASHKGTQRTGDPDVDFAWFARLHDLQADIRLYGEAFYYFAWRARQALAAIPDHNLSFDPVGVRDVRNHMLEHPDKRGGVIILSWMFDCPQGLVLEPQGSPVPVPNRDPGLYPNAEEFVRKLQLKLKGLDSRAAQADGHNEPTDSTLKATSDL